MATARFIFTKKATIGAKSPYRLTSLLIFPIPKMMLTEIGNIWPANLCAT